MANALGTPLDNEGVASRLAIQDILHTHSRGLDRCVAEWIKSSYWPDATVAYGSFDGPAHTFADIVVSVLAKQYELTQHSLGNILVEIRGRTAHSESVVTAHHLLRGGREELLYSGRYLDLLEQREGCWKLSARTVVMDWSRRLEVMDERETEAFAGLAKGANDGTDPLHAFWPRPD